MRGIYVHVPFCVRKCAYCDFYSIAADRAAMAGFRDLLVREMELFRRELPGEAAAPADTVFFGGGTPTALGAEGLVALLAAVRERFPVGDGAEVTTEANPGAVSATDFKALRSGGFNRVSIGVQSFDAKTLKTLGRIHGAGEIRAAWRNARAAGFPSVGLDLIFGVPGQTAASFAADLEQTVACAPAHVSAYALAPEPGTPLHAAVGRGELRMPPDDDVAEMYDAARRTLAASGLRQYEISNFSRPGAECRHNLKYWRREGYHGFGPSAHGLAFPPGKAPLGLRAANPPSLSDYARRIREGRLPWTQTRVCRRADAWKESLIFGLREIDGVDAAEIEKRIGAPPQLTRDAVNSLVASGRLLREGSRLRLPEALLFVSNEVLQRLA